VTEAWGWRASFLVLSVIVIYVSPPADWLRIVVPASQRGAMLAINNSVASLAGIAAPVMTRVR
jgi:hypothetical protein